MVNSNNGEHRDANAELAESAVLALAGNGGPDSLDVQDEAAPLSLKSGREPGGGVGVVAPSRIGPHPERLALEFEAARADLRVALVQAKARLLGVIQEELHRFSGEVLGSLQEHGGGKGPVATGVPVSRDLAAERVPGPAGAVTPISTRTESASPPYQPPAQATSNSGSVPAAALPLAVDVTPVAPADGSPPQVSAATPEAPAVPVAASGEFPDGEVDEGTVRLSLRVEGCVRQMLDFVNKLSQKRQLRVVRLVGNHRDGLDVWVGLREPLCMKKVLLQMEGVATVNDLPGARVPEQGRQLEVWLKDAA